MTDIAIIGAGPGGIAAARWLKAQGFSPIIFEAHTEVGGQWSVSNPMSGVWPQMVTNTFLEATRFSDLPYPKGTPLFPHNGAVRAYFENYAREYGLLDLVQFRTRLIKLARKDGTWALLLKRDGEQFERRFERVVVATGRFNKPVIPVIPGHETFSGDLGIIHSFNYKDPFAYQNRNVVVLGGAISSLEIASDLSMLGAASVHLAQRRQRYVNPKMVRGLPIEYLLFTYERGALALDDPETLLKDSEEKILRYSGDPSRYGTPKPHPEFSKAGATGSQHYLNLVAEGRVTPVEWPERISGRTLRFPGGSHLDVDGIISGTGFALNLPFLDEETRDTLRLSDNYIELDEFTLHPDLPGLAFLGLWSQAGSYPTPLEQQARYLAYSWGSVIQARSEETMRAGLQDCAQNGHHTGYRTQSEMALRFARLCGTDPKDPQSDDLAQTIRKSATSGLLYRLVGPDAFDDGPKQLTAQYTAFCPED
ncbi:FAD-dependent oxidoreductase [Roseibium sp. HPY-6]|uniref:flavin-containing monooxygenase n=1 Tax=Roseibium sp. HPY-6 TaxID=3229852 RepID=UPI00338FAD85